jgi:hypothetical protein
MSNKPVQLEAAANIDIQAAADGKSESRPTFKIIAYSGGALKVESYPYPVVVRLSGVRAKGKVAALLDHDRSQIVGQGKARINADGITVDGIVTGDTANPGEPAAKVVSHAKAGFEWATSIGLSVDKLQFVPDGSTVKANGQEFAGPVYLVTSGRLGEVSFVSVGADESATATIAAEAADIGDTVMAETNVQAAGNGSTTPAPVVDVESIKAQAAIAERNRINQIEADCKGFECKASADLKAKAVAGEIDRPALLAGLLSIRNAAMPQAPAPAVHVSKAADLRAIEAAACLSAGAMNEDQGVKAYGADVMDQAYKFRRMGIRETMERALAACGLTLRVDREISRDVRAAFSTNEAAAGVFGAVANKAIARQFAPGRSAAERICGVASHQNFHAHTVYTLGISGTLEKVAPTGEIKHLAMDSENYTRQVETRGAMLGVSRQDLINDDLGALAQAATNIAQKAYTARELAAFTAINATGAGASHFTAARGNYISGANTTLTHDGVRQAVAAFRALEDKNRNPLLVEPRILLVPRELEYAAKLLVAPMGTLIASGLASTSAASVQSNANIYVGAFEVVQSTLLSKSTITGYSTTAWYLLTDPASGDPAAVELAYLNGVQTPVVEQVDQPADVLGIAWRVFYDFGVAMAEWRAGVKSKGAA